ncbi:MAG TPA: sporulation integral membrane protein YtvI [Halanaerobiaceae bacterium]|jgi:sporulation integral membrane protein YtvI|nr:sporulation integral membrane protein YtvI [Bacillota bacterium]HHU93336.1 sporulation integral membrane protein YtvI [Halanaerobiaceae bacterium]HOA40521.1 sporulation integral membrane protein YtvI [Halanaerobiales bacterium]HPZ62753.1 sporulation integral membrane protein YtvI [Halanaerobiales bacterium]HQD04036.1 sporulation integral membrane protein YtvI [Halanaerobiales bacterium]
MLDLKAVNWKKAIFLFILFLFIFLGLRVFIFILTPFFLGFLIAIIIDKPVNFMSRKIPRSLAVLIMIALVLSVSLLLAIFLITTSINELTYLIRYLPRYYEEIVDFTNNLLLRLRDFFEQLPGMFNLALYNNLENLYNYGSDIIFNITNRIVNATFNIPNMFLILLFTVISGFFISKDKELLTNYLFSRIKFIGTEYAEILTDIFTYIKVQLIIVTNTTIITALAFSLLRYPYAIILALLAGILDLIPVLGPGAIYIPVVIINLFFNIKHAVIVMIVYIIIIGVRPILESKVVGKRIGVHPIVLLLGVYLGLKLFGFQGVIIAPISIIIFKALLDAGIYRYNTGGKKGPPVS